MPKVSTADHDSLHAVSTVLALSVLSVLVKLFMVFVVLVLELLALDLSEVLGASILLRVFVRRSSTEHRAPVVSDGKYAWGPLTQLSIALS